MKSRKKDPHAFRSYHKLLTEIVTCMFNIKNFKYFFYCMKRLLPSGSELEKLIENVFKHSIVKFYSKTSSIHLQKSLIMNDMSMKAIKQFASRNLCFHLTR
ncbi:CLUMA_CG020325, isoform A [Clunio marinus]|uniref:CLUMA_CG020325, isoform A n=1 Tax=Clunio marinus TaxID=568069 RepID=A0A1J1J8T0_9DIPT|nr:CLUMA_CG020325, isoform A [Clunio marinus]